MNKVAISLFFVLLGFSSVISKRPIWKHECEESVGGYIVPDEYRCDQYAKCLPNGRRIILVCDAGSALDVQDGKCKPVENVDCEGRNELYVPPPGSRCLQPYGNLPIDGQCSQYVNCRFGKEFILDCPAGTVYDTATANCILSQDSTRKECSTKIIDNFECPDYETDFKRLRFGRHDRLAHPNDCSKFYICFRSGKSVISTCPSPKVFDPVTGFCQDYKTVESCSTFYDNKNKYEIREIQL